MKISKSRLSLTVAAVITVLPYLWNVYRFIGDVLTACSLSGVQADQCIASASRVLTDLPPWAITLSVLAAVFAFWLFQRDSQNSLKDRLSQLNNQTAEALSGLDSITSRQSTLEAETRREVEELDSRLKNDVEEVRGMWNALVEFKDTYKEVLNARASDTRDLGDAISSAREQLDTHRRYHDKELRDLYEREGRMIRDLEARMAKLESQEEH